MDATLLISLAIGASVMLAAAALLREFLIANILAQSNS